MDESPAAGPAGDGPGKGALERVLGHVRREGLWLLAGLAALASVNVFALLRDPMAAKDAIRIAPGDVLLAVLALAAAVEVVLYRRPWLRALPPPAAFGIVAAAAVSGVVLVVREWGGSPGRWGGSRARSSSWSKSSWSATAGCSGRGGGNATWTARSSRSRRP